MTEEAVQGQDVVASQALTYPRAFFGTLIAALFLFVGLSAFFWEPLTGMPLEGHPGWYRDYGGRNFPEISDQDLFYHDIGGSIAAAKAAGIVILGPSFSTYAFDRDILRQFAHLTGIEPYNMSFIGIRGGEFSLRVIERWGIHAPLWLINVDDQFTHFFSRSTELTIGSNTERIRTLQFSRLHGFLNVVERALRWRYEDWLANWRNGREIPSGMYRSIETGDVMVDVNPRYLADDNKPLVISRDQNCHVSPQTVEIAKEYLKSIDGEVVLTLVPHSQYCPLQARELALALGVEIILPPPDGYSTIDGGGHLDKRSATKFTNFVLRHLVETAAFKRAFPGAIANRGAGP